MTELEEFVKIFTLSLGSLVEGIAAVVVGSGIIKAVYFYLKSLTSVSSGEINVRLALGKTLAIALEFLLSADILRTAVAPTWSDIGKLAAIAALRTLLNYFLDRELETGLRHAELKNKD
jgi:uncharacterized membrane protein